MASTITIVFEGLMILHDDKKNKRMEIGVLNAHGHFLRIEKRKKDTVIKAIDLDGFKTSKADLPISIKTPAMTGIHFHPTDAGDIDRHDDKHADKDFRYILDLEGNEFYKAEVILNPNLIDTTKLNPVFYLEHGTFSTHERSEKRFLRGELDPSSGPMKPKPKPGTQKPFGFVAAGVGCQISFTGDAPILQAPDGSTIFTFTPEAGITYYILNTPKTSSPTDPDHFPMFYDIFTGKVMQYTFEEDSGGTLPSPQICGTPRMSLKKNPLRVKEM